MRLRENDRPGVLMKSFGHWLLSVRSVSSRMTRFVARPLKREPRRGTAHRIVRDHRCCFGQLKLYLRAKRLRLSRFWGRWLVGTSQYLRDAAYETTGDQLQNLEVAMSVPCTARQAKVKPRYS